MISVWSMNHFFSKTEPPILFIFLYKIYYTLNEVFKKILWNSIHKQKNFVKGNFFFISKCPSVCPMSVRMSHVRPYVPCPDVCPDFCSLYKNVRMYVPISVHMQNSLIRVADLWSEFHILFWQETSTKSIHQKLLQHWLKDLYLDTT